MPTQTYAVHTRPTRVNAAQPTATGRPAVNAAHATKAHMTVVPTHTPVATRDREICVLVFMDQSSTALFACQALMCDHAFCLKI